jgi:hypothetical protein
MTYLKIALAAVALFEGIALTAVPATAASTATNCQPGTGVFTACFYSGTSFNTFLLQRQDPQINFTWGLSGPYSGGPIFQFSARWQGNFSFAPAGNYRFTVSANQGARLYIDGQMVLNNWSNPGASSDVVQALTAGTHLITFEYFNGWDYANAQLSWQQDSGFREFYVSPSGSDQNDGRTPGTAWLTALKVDFATFQPGDHIMFQGGQSFAGPIYFGANDQGTSALPIVVTSYGTGPATIQAGTSVGLLAYNTAGLEVRNLNFVGAQGNTQDGVQFYQNLSGNVTLSHVLIDSVEISGFGSAGISIFGSAGLSGYSGVQITNVSSHDNLWAGIWMGSTSGSVGYANSNVYIGNCQTYNISGVTDFLTDTGFGIYLASTNGAVIEQNVVYNNGQNTLSVAGPMGIMAMGANNVVIQNNEVHDMHTWGQDGGGIDLDNGVTNSFVQYNYTHNNAGSGITLTSSPNTIRYNISQNDGRNSLSSAGILVAGTSQGSHIYNNTFYGTANSSGTYAALAIIGTTTNFDIRNNVFFTTGGMKQLSVAGGQVQTALQDNSYWGGGSPLNLSWGGTSSQTLAAFRTNSGQETINGMPTGQEINPLLTAPGTGPTFNQASLLPTLTAYTPLSGSPLIDRGLTLSAFGINPGTRDFIGTSIPQLVTFDIGAIEAISH